MSRGKPYFAGLTKTKLTSEIQDELKKFDFNQEFESQLISDLIAEKHYYCAQKGIHPIRFRKSFRPGAAYDFEGYFPNHGWHMVSWRQCITPRNELDWIKRALRDAVQPIVSSYKSLHPTCERCSLKPSEHVDHVHPEFDVMANQAIDKLSKTEIDAIFVNFNWWSEEPFSLPPSHSIVNFICNAHETAKLQAVCQPCHIASARERHA
ncbi:hypothetical protein [Pseudomonas leptonychotis]|uniref:hypothetical protein n=1 Tax=Pseudomonas leptonychotis TaxID=2448482 RepID=UPI0039F09896